MANNITGNPIYIDTAATIYTQRFKLDGGAWSNAAATNVLTLTDYSGRTIFKATYPTSLDQVDIPKIGWVNGLICTVIGGGSCTIYVGNK